MEDFEIVELYFTRDKKAAEETKAKYGKLLYRIGYNILNSREDAEECENDVYLQIWNSIPPEKPSNFKAYICKIARNLSLTRWKYNNAQKRSGRFLVPLDEMEEIISDNCTWDSKELGLLINDFLKAQAPRDRNVFIRRYWFMDSIGDIAKDFSFTESKVKSILSRTRNKLKKYLTKEGIDL